MDTTPMPRRWSEVTSRQAEAVAVVERITAEKGYAPTLREIASALGVNVPRAHQLVRVCCRKGALAMDPLIPRSIHIPRKR